MENVWHVLKKKKIYKDFNIMNFFYFVGKQYCAGLWTEKNQGKDKDYEKLTNYFDKQRIF